MTDWERVFRDACDEIGCAYDNEALLQAISDLKRSRGPAQAPGDAYWKEQHRVAVLKHIECCGPCRNCGAPIDEVFCGTCREMGCSLPSTEPRIAQRLADVVMMLDTPDAYNREYIAAVCRSILSSVSSTEGK